MIPKIHDRSGRTEHPGADETAVLPPVRDVHEARETNPADRVPRGIFRDERPAEPAQENENERTRELPQIGDPHAAAPRPVQDHRGRRPRPDWAEETPLDDLPTLADELLGDHRDDEDSGSSGRGRRPRR